MVKQSAWHFCCWAVLNFHAFTKIRLNNKCNVCMKSHDRKGLPNVFAFALVILIYSPHVSILLSINLQFLPPFILEHSASALYKFQDGQFFWNTNMGTEERHVTNIRIYSDIYLKIWIYSDIVTAQLYLNMSWSLTW